MVADDRNVPGLPLSPLEAQTPLIVDADAALTIPMAAQGLKSISGRHAQIVERSGAVQHRQLALRLPHHIVPPKCFTRLPANRAAISLSAKLLIMSAG
jgi:hypothetical protein